jgi:hypothetical protein
VIEEQFPYTERVYFQWLSERLESALQTAKVLSVVINAPTPFSELEKATIAIAPSSLSIASSIKILVSQGYTPSARLLVRPLLERATALDFIANEESGLKIWMDGWRQGKRPSLGALLKRLDGSPELDASHFQKRIVDDLNAVVHADPDGLASLMSPSRLGTGVHWLEKHPEDFDAADTVCSATALSVVLIESNLKRVFQDKVKAWKPPDSA